MPHSAITFMVDHCCPWTQKHVTKNWRNPFPLETTMALLCQSSCNSTTTLVTCFCALASPSSQALYKNYIIMHEAKSELQTFKVTKIWFRTESNAISPGLQRQLGILAALYHSARILAQKVTLLPPQILMTLCCDAIALTLFIRIFDLFFWYILHHRYSTHAAKSTLCILLISLLKRLSAYFPAAKEIQCNRAVV